METSIEKSKSDNKPKQKTENQRKTIKRTKAELKKTIFLTEKPEWYSEEELKKKLEIRGNLELFIHKKIHNKKEETHSDCYYAVFEEEAVAQKMISQRKLKIKNKLNSGKITVYRCTKNKEELVSHQKLMKDKLLNKLADERKRTGEKNWKKIKKLKAKKKGKEIKKLKKLGLFKPNEKKKKDKNKGIQLSNSARKIQNAVLTPLTAGSGMFYSPQNAQMMNFLAMSLGLSSPSHLQPGGEYSQKLQPKEDLGVFSFENNQGLNLGGNSEVLNQKETNFEFKVRFEKAGIIEEGVKCFFKPTMRDYYKSNLKRRIHFENFNSSNLRFNWGRIVPLKE